MIINPRSDAEFARFVDEQAPGVSDAAELQANLRQRYPHTTVRGRELSGETAQVWYVYRDGRWTSTDAPSVTMSEEEREDLKATAENIVHDAEQLQQVELLTLSLADADTNERIQDLAAQAEELAEDIAEKARAEKELADNLS